MKEKLQLLITVMLGYNVDKAEDQPGGQYAALQRILEQQDKADGDAPQAGMELS